MGGARAQRTESRGSQADQSPPGRVSSGDGNADTAISAGDAASDPKEPGRRRVRRHIPQLILRELSFSGQAMTATQIAKAIDYHPEQTETALRRMEETAKCFGTQGTDGQSAPQPWVNSMATLPLVTAKLDPRRTRLAAQYSTEVVRITEQLPARKWGWEVAPAAVSSPGISGANRMSRGIAVISSPA